MFSLILVLHPVRSMAYGTFDCIMLHFSCFKHPIYKAASNYRITIDARQSQYSLFQVLKVLKQGFELETLGFAQNFHSANWRYHLSYSASYEHAQLCFHEKNKILPFGFVPQLFLSLKLHVMLKVLGTKIKYKS